MVETGTAAVLFRIGSMILPRIAWNSFVLDIVRREGLILCKRQFLVPSSQFPVPSLEFGVSGLEMERKFVGICGFLRNGFRI